jgi:3-hydroxy-9,10-secoandrosta-1,3,5(10)-triene-9,17-dione monooxygenase reductase component
MGSCEPMTAIHETREAGVAGTPGVSAVEFREAIGHFATGVTVVTSIGEDGEPVGTTANAVTSLSLDPSLLLVCFDLSSATLRAIRSHGAFVVNVLGHRQRHLSPTSPGAASPQRGTGCGTAAGRPAARG